MYVAPASAAAPRSAPQPALPGGDRLPLEGASGHQAAPELTRTLVLVRRVVRAEGIAGALGGKGWVRVWRYFRRSICMACGGLTETQYY